MFAVQIPGGKCLQKRLWTVIYNRIGINKMKNRHYPLIKYYIDKLNKYIFRYFLLEFTFMKSDVFLFIYF